MKLIDQQRKIREKIEALHAERDQVIFDSTAAKLSRLELAIRDASAEFTEIGKQISSLASENISPREAELAQLITESIHTERGLIGRLGGTGLPEKFVRADAVAHFRKTRDKSQQEINAIHTRRQGVALTLRDRETIADLSLAIREFDRIKPLAAMGERIAQERANRQRLADEESQLEAERKQKALAST